MQKIFFLLPKYYVLCSSCHILGRASMSVLRVRRLENQDLRGALRDGSSSSLGSTRRHRKMTFMTSSQSMARSRLIYILSAVFICTIELSKLTAHDIKTKTLMTSPTDLNHVKLDQIWNNILHMFECIFVPEHPPEPGSPNGFLEGLRSR